jgi:hypothetical protein
VAANRVVVLRWRWPAAPADSGEPEAWDDEEGSEEHQRSGKNWIRVGKAGAHRERSSTVAQSSGEESMLNGRRGGGGHRLRGCGAAVSSSRGRGGEGGPRELSE